MTAPADLGAWLRQIGLERYERLLRANAIDMDVVCDLRNEDLAELGVPIGDRKRFLNAVAALRSGSSARAGFSEAERRMVAILFCDLVGSTPLAARFDAEDWRELLSSYIAETAAVVERLDGYVLKILGDGVMAVFGYPKARENDAERATRAGLAIHSALATLRARNGEGRLPPLVARIGIDFGPVVVDADGEVFGESPNVAARVQNAAEPGELLVTARVQREIAGLFVADDLGPQALKGVPEPVPLYRIVRASGTGRRSAQRKRTPFVGRGAELATLLGRWRGVRAGKGQVVLLSGEPGIGKSRLIEEFQNAIRDAPHTWIEWRASQLLQNTPLHPVVEWGRTRYGGDEIENERRLAELTLSLRQVGLDADQVAPFVASLVDIQVPAALLPKMAPEELRRRQMEAIVAWVLAGARAQPLVLAIEDLHWADPSTLEVLSQIVERAGEARLLVLSSARPEFNPPWRERPQVGVLTLPPLEREQVLTMVSEIAAHSRLSEDAVQSVSERSGGVPLFVEEVTQLLMKRGARGDEISIPPTLQQLLTARLDDLGPAREAAMIGAVLGREFSYALIRAVAGLDETELKSALNSLCKAGVLLAEGRPPEARYRFKHALIQDSAYGTLLKRRRQTLHRAVAEATRDRFAARAEVEPEAIAYHFTLAGETSDAIHWWSKAGDQALRRSAFLEASAHLGKAIELADAVDASAADSEWHRRRVKLQSDYATAIAWLRGFGADETKAAYARAGELADVAGQSSVRAVSYYGAWVGHSTRADLAAARQCSLAFIAEMQSGGASALLATAHRCAGMTAWLRGDYRAAYDHLTAVLDMSDDVRDREGRAVFGQDTSAVAMLYLSHVYWLTGRIATALDLFRRGMAKAEAAEHLPTLVNSLDEAVLIAVARDDHAAARPLAARMAELSDGPRLVFYSARAKLILSWCAAREGGGSAAVEQLRADIDAYTATTSLIVLPLYLGLLAEAEAEGGAPTRALATIEKALEASRVTGEGWTDPPLLRIRGDILAMSGNAHGAEAAYLAAYETALRQDSRCFALQTAMRLARLQGPEGRARLAAALAAIPEPEGWDEIAAARTLLSSPPSG